MRRYSKTSLPMKFPELLTSLGVETVTEGNKHCRAGWVQLDCPFCGKGSGKFHMGYSIAGNYLNCYSCRGHSLISTLMELTGMSAGKAKALLGELERDTFTETEIVGRLQIPDGVAPMLPVHRKYLRSRGFDPDYCEKVWDFRGIGLAQKLSWRVWIPIYHGGKIVSWTARSVSKEAKLRYVSAAKEQESVSHKKILFGADFVGNAAVIVEGPLDAVKIGRGAVATCGTGWTRAQLRRMASFPVRAVCFDNEPSAQLRADELVAELSLFDGETLKVCLDAKDAGDASPKELRQLRRAVGLGEI